jgi:chorismate mutase
MIIDLLAYWTNPIYSRLTVMPSESEFDLKTARKRLDRIDKELVSLLGERFTITNQIGQYKKARKLSPVDEDRERIQLERIEQLAESVGLDPAFARRFLRCIIDEVVTNHKKAGSE